MHAVDGVDLEVAPGETLGLVGETGLRQVARSRASRCGSSNRRAGKIWFDGTGHHPVKGDELRALRRDMQMVFQDPYASLNPRKTVGSIIGAPLRLHRTVAEGQDQARGTGAHATWSG